MVNRIALDTRFSFYYAILENKFSDRKIVICSKTKLNEKF